jgi:hypothetical protein
MQQPETRAWWDDVQYLRESIERKREDEARRGLRLDARSAARAVAERAAGEAHAATFGTPDRAEPRRTRRLERRAPERRGPLAPPRRRRTVEITGRTVGAPTLPRLVEIDRRRPARRPVERVGARPDRLALWAVVLGLFLILVAVTSTSHAATRPHAAPVAAGHSLHQQVVGAHAAALRATPPAR